jgi:hypothetical protein
MFGSVKYRFYRQALCLVVLTGVLLTGACTKLCKSGYEGKNCNTEVRAKFEGTWFVIDTPAQPLYTNVVNAASNISTVEISSSFAQHHFSSPLYASVTGLYIYIPPQSPDGTDSIQGSGTINSGYSQLNIGYTIWKRVDTVVTSEAHAEVWMK